MHLPKVAVGISHTFLETILWLKLNLTIWEVDLVYTLVLVHLRGDLSLLVSELILRLEVVVLGIFITLVPIDARLVHVQLVWIGWSEGWDEVLCLLVCFEGVGLLWRIEVLLLRIKSNILLVFVLSRLLNELLLIWRVAFIVSI